MNKIFEAPIDPTRLILPAIAPHMLPGGVLHPLTPKKPGWEFVPGPADPNRNPNLPPTRTWPGGVETIENDRYQNIPINPNEIVAMTEEIVNSNNAGSMTKSEISLRDKIEKKVKGIKPIKKGDSEKNARYRFATYLVLKKREKEKGKKETKGKKKKK